MTHTLYNFQGALVEKVQGAGVESAPPQPPVLIGLKVYRLYDYNKWFKRSTMSLLINKFWNLRKAS